MYKEFLVIFDKEFFFDFELLCHSLQIKYIVKSINSYFIIFIYEEDYEKAYLNLNDLIREDLNYFSPYDEIINNVIIINDSISFFSYSIIGSIILFFFYYELTGQKYYFFDIGANNAYLVVKGEFYRCITSLTLHANLLHILSNMVFFVVIYRYVIKIFGEGLGWLLIVLSGFLGNLMTSFFYQHYHSSIGFSTSIFGVVGILSCINLKVVKNFLPVVAGFFLFIMLGGGKNVDVIAHISGFISGIILTEILLKKYKFLIDKKYQNKFKVLVILIFLGSWGLAFNFS